MNSVSGMWHPAHSIELIAGTAPGGGLDRTARALQQAMAASGVVDVPVEVVNMPGDGARKPWHCLAKVPGDAHRVSISSPNLTTDFLTGVATFDHTAFTPLAILYTEYIAFIARSDSPVRTGADLLARLARDAAGFSVALSTSAGNPNHIAFAKVVRAAGVDPRMPRVRVFDSALDAVADVVNGNADSGAVTAASTIRALERGDVRLLAVSAPHRLRGALAGTPTWAEQGIECEIGAWRGVSGPPGLSIAQIAYWDHVLGAATRAPTWIAGLDDMGWSAAHLGGAALHQALHREVAEMRLALRELGLLRA